MLPSIALSADSPSRFLSSSREGERESATGWWRGLCEGDNVITFDTHLKLIDGALDLRWLRLWPLPKCAGTTTNNRHKREREGEGERNRQVGGQRVWRMWQQLYGRYMVDTWVQQNNTWGDCSARATREESDWALGIGEWEVASGLHKQLRLSMGCFAARHVAC